MIDMLLVVVLALSRLIPAAFWIWKADEELVEETKVALPFTPSEPWREVEPPTLSPPPIFWLSEILALLILACSICVPPT